MLGGKYFFTNFSIFFNVYFIRAIDQITSRRSSIRANMNSAKGIDAIHIVNLLVGFQEKIEHDPYSESTYQISRTIAHTLSNKKTKSFSAENLQTIRKGSEVHNGK